MSKNKSSKNRSFTDRLASSRGRIVGVTTVSKNQVRKLNGQVRSVSPSYVTIFDRNRKELVKFASSTIQSVTGV